jgi:HEAT repeat protein
MEIGRVEQIEELLEMLDGDDLDDRPTAIQVLGEIGDEEVLKILRGAIGLGQRGNNHGGPSRRG